jgi:hypothetical protein
MDTNQTLINSGITVAMYIFYKVAQRYYLKSNCNDNKVSLEIGKSETPHAQTVELADIKTT